MSDLHWTSARPAVPGWYWWRRKMPNGIITDVFEVNEQLKVYNDQTHAVSSVYEFQGEWAGPIPEPREGE